MLNSSVLITCSFRSNSVRQHLSMTEHGQDDTDKATRVSMKVLLATDCYLFQTGGVTSVVVSLENGLRKNGCDVKVLALANGNRSYREGDSYFIRSLRFPDYPEHRFSLAMHDPLLNELMEWNPDIIHIHTEATAGWMAQIIAKKTDTPVVMTTHTDFEFFMFGRFRGIWIIRKLAAVWGKRAYKMAETVIVPAEKARDFPHLQPVRDKVTVVPNGIELDRYQKPVSPEEKEALFSQYGLRDNGYTLVMITRLSKEKNAIEILQFFPNLLRVLPEAQLVIVGEGPDRKRLETFTAQNGLSEHVRFTGRISPDIIYRYYAMGDLFVSASTFELHSMSYLEAMACGLPLVCREDSSLRGVLENGKNGFIYRNEQEFIDAVSEILKSATLRERMSEEALRRAETAGNQYFVERMLALYRSVCSSWASHASEQQKES